MRFEEFELTEAGDLLFQWFSENGRDLPWRRDTSAYHVWVSEIMLQQTRVEAVKPYFERFMEALPRIEDLAACPEEKYLKLWEGLGYYSRVRNLHKAAELVVKEHQGKMPEDFDVLLKLPGIGRYTAGAVSSIAYGKKEPSVDGNVLRVLTRLTGDDSDIALQKTKDRAEQVLREYMQSDAFSHHPGLFNQALMDLGATVCVPNGEPHCEICPWQGLCIAEKEGRTAELPVKTKKTARKIEKRTILLLTDRSHAALRKRPEKGLLAGLWEFPGLEGHLSQKEIAAYAASIGFTAIRIQKLPQAKHIFSHIEWHMIGYEVLVEEDALASEEQLLRRGKEKLELRLFSDIVQNYAIPSAFAKYMPFIRDRIK